ncbi:MAG: Fur family transcriptional regulator [Pseudomonadota bacterium]
MVNVVEALDEAEQRCKAEGARLTDKRKQVLEGLLNSDTALSAYQLVDYCKERYNQSIPAMSVYRILDFLQSQKLVHKLELANKYVACSQISCKQDECVSQFLICQNCQRVEEVDIDKSTLRAIERSVKAAGFRLASQQLEMHCLCEECM